MQIRHYHFFSTITSVDYPPARTIVGAPVKDFNLPGLLAGLPEKVRASRISEAHAYALAATQEALASAGLLNEKGKIPESLRERTGLVIGTSIGGAMLIGIAGVAINEAKEKQDEVRIPPTALLKIIPDRTSSVPDMVFGIEGPSFSVAAACATGNVAVTVACDQILFGRADVMVAGSSEAVLNEIGLAYFERSALSGSKDPQFASQPFDKNRSGFVLSEGAGVLVLEELTHALKRGARPLAEVVGYANTTDGEPEHDTDPAGDGQYRAMTIAMLGIIGQLTPETPIFVSAHATGTRIGDKTEAETIKEALPRQKTVYVYAPKGALGHGIAASAAIEAAMLIRTINTGIIPPTLGLYNPIAETEGLIIPTKATQVNVRIGINNAFGFGGFNSVIVFKAYEDTPR